MKILPRISIITPSFNQGTYIEETICSVLDQHYPNLEYIIIDGGSTDKTLGIIKKYQKYVNYWVSEKDKGQSDAINKGYRRATGDIINWLNSDDYYQPDALKRVGEVFKNPETNVYCGISRIFGNNKEYFSNGTDIYPGNLEKTIGWARIDQPETFFRKSVWDTLGGIDERFHYLMDKEFWIRYLLYYGLKGIVKDKSLLVNFRLHNNSKTVSQASGFLREGINLFYTLAANFGLDKEKELITDIGKPELMDWQCPNNHAEPARCLHYFLFFLLAEAYAQNNRERFNLIKPGIIKTLLRNDDRKLFDKLVFRHKFLPPGIKKMWNKHYG